MCHDIDNSRDESLPQRLILQTIPLRINQGIRVADMNTLQPLPRFLLPRISWTGSASGPLNSASVALLQTQRRQPWQNPTKTSQRNRTLSSQAYGSRVARPPQTGFKSPSLRRAFHATTRNQRDHHFDTLKFVHRLKEDGFTEEQSAAMMKVLNDVIEER